MDKYIPAAELR